MKANKLVLYSSLLLFGIIFLFLVTLYVGSVKIPFQAITDLLLGNQIPKSSWKHIVLEVRLPQAITALITGSSIAVSGLLLQTTFRNPLADSGILGVSAGASLGVAVVVMLLGGYVSNTINFSLSSSMTIVVGAFIGASMILGIIIIFSTVIKNNIMLLIIGIMLGYITSSLITVLKFWSTNEELFTYVMWGMGNFAGVTMAQLPFYCGLNLIALILSFLLIKPLNALLLGERYAANLGINVVRLRFMLLLCAGLITAITTAYCGPIAFIGLSVPHISRLLLGTSNHKLLLPITMLFGALIALICNLVSVIPLSSGLLPLNAITPIFGAPVIIYVILNQKKIQYFS